MRTPAACRGQLRFRLLLLPLLVLAAAATSEDWVELPSSGDGEAAEAAAPGPAYAEEQRPARLRIVGGTASSSAEHSYAVAIRIVRSSGKRYRCTGTLIWADLVLTAAHCVVDPLDPLYRVTMHIGYTSLDDTPDYDTSPPVPGAPVVGETLVVARFKAHERFNSTTLANDIAILQSDTLSRATPAYLDLSGRSTLVGGGALAIGFGSTTAQSGLASATATITLPDTLYAVQLPVVDGALCVRSWGATLFSTANQLCAGRREGGADTCSGDSGGPLLSLGKASPDAAAQAGAVVGITSFGFGCGVAKSYSVYTRVSAYAAWLTQSAPGLASAAPPPPPGAALAVFLAPNATVCETARFGQVAVLDCGAQVIAAIDFASFGTPTGTCGSFGAGSCASPSHLAAVEALCLGRQHCSIDVSTATFTDPCPSTLSFFKGVALQARCTPRATPPSPPAPPVVPPPPHPPPSPPVPARPAKVAAAVDVAGIDVTSFNALGLQGAFASGLASFLSVVAATVEVTGASTPIVPLSTSPGPQPPPPPSPRPPPPPPLTTVAAGQRRARALLLRGSRSGGGGGGGAQRRLFASSPVVAVAFLVSPATSAEGQRITLALLNATNATGASAARLLRALQTAGVATAVGARVSQAPAALLPPPAVAAVAADETVSNEALVRETLIWSIVPATAGSMVGVSVAGLFCLLWRRHRRRRRDARRAARANTLADSLKSWAEEDAGGSRPHSGRKPGKARDSAASLGGEEKPTRRLERRRSMSKIAPAPTGEDEEEDGATEAGTGGATGREWGHRPSDDSALVRGGVPGSEATAAASGSSNDFSHPSAPRKRSSFSGPTAKGAGAGGGPQREDSPPVLSWMALEAEAIEVKEWPKPPRKGGGGGKQQAGGSAAHGGSIGSESMNASTSTAGGPWGGRWASPTAAAAELGVAARRGNPANGGWVSPLGSIDSKRQAFHPLPVAAAALAPAGGTAAQQSLDDLRLGTRSERARLPGAGRAFAPLGLPRQPPLVMLSPGSGTAHAHLLPRQLVTPLGAQRELMVVPGDDQDSSDGEPSPVKHARTSIPRISAVLAVAAAPQQQRQDSKRRPAPVAGVPPAEQWFEPPASPSTSSSSDSDSDRSNSGRHRIDSP